VTLDDNGCAVVDRRMTMAQVIEFYTPARFQKKVKWVPEKLPGKVIEFPANIKKSA
jgi:hypothetical protein